MTQKPRNADYTKEYNRKAVLSMLRRSSMSRAELEIRARIFMSIFFLVSVKTK